jgi:hypothetical protein
LGIAGVVALAAFLVGTVFFRNLTRFVRYFSDSSHLGTHIRIYNLGTAIFDGCIILVLCLIVFFLLGRERKQRWIKITAGIATVLSAVWGLYAGQL